MLKSSHFGSHISLQYLTQHMGIVYNSVQCLMDFFGEVNRENWQAAKCEREKIKQFTQEARTLENESRKKNASSLFTHTDILHLMHMQTHIANKAQAISGLVIGRHLSLPPLVAIEYFPFLNVSIATIQQSYLVINRLENITSAQDPFRAVLSNMICELDRLENESDHLQVTARNVLFQLEKTLSPIDALSLYKLLEWTGDLADGAHDLGGCLITSLAP